MAANQYTSNTTGGWNIPPYMPYTSSNITTSTVYTTSTSAVFPHIEDLPDEIYALLKDNKFSIDKIETRLENKNITEIGWLVKFKETSIHNIIFGLQKGTKSFIVTFSDSAARFYLAFDNKRTDIVLAALKTSIPMEYNSLLADSALNDFPELTYLVKT